MKEDEQLRLPDGRQIGFGDYGDPAGKPVIYFHGWPSSRYQAALVHELAAERGLRIIAPDRPGVGLSDPSPRRGFAGLAPDVAGLADVLGIGRFLLYGMSGGSPYALATAAALPDRVVATAIVCGAPPLGNPADRVNLHWTYRSLIALRRLRRAATPAAIAASRWMIARGIDRAPMTWMLRSIAPADREAIADAGCWESVTRSYLEAVRNGADRVVDQGERYLEPWDFSPEDIRGPVAFWHGLADKNLPCEVAKKLAARIPGVECHWEPDEGHYSLPLRYRAPVLDWLRAR